MPNNTVYFIDTSVLVEMLRIPGKSDPHRFETISNDFAKFQEQDARFLLPVTALIETGNFIAQSTGDRHQCALAFRRLIDQALSSNPPWRFSPSLWDEPFVAALLDGDSTGDGLVNHLSNGTLGTGDMSILVERDLFKKKTAYKDVRIWTLDAKLKAYS